MRLCVLGALEVDGTTRTLPPRDRVVISALAVRLGQRVDREELADALWGEHPPSTSAKQIQASISRLRQGLGGETVETTAGGYRLREEAVDLDSREFEAHVERAREHTANRSPERAIASYDKALSLWRGPAYDAAGDWLPARLEAIRLGELRLCAEEELLRARLDTGDHRGAATAGVVLAREQPYRERRWTLLALAQYRDDRQADALRSIRTARRVLSQELGLDPGSELVALESAILAQDPALAADHEARLVDDECPWKGLVAYGPEDHDSFFGREADVVACLNRLHDSPLLVVTGPSGCGKSSLVHAGLVPALRRGGRQVEVFTPGPDGATAMAAALAHAKDPVLVIDQLEEAFTTGTDAAARQVWLGEIARYASDTTLVVLTVRSDHVASLGDHVELARLTEQGLHLVTQLSGAGLREVVEAPAHLAGLRIEPGLVELLLRDAEDEPGALPLLSHALTETWRRRDSGLLTVDGYREAGGIRGAVSASAERVYDGLTTSERADLRWLMLRLVSLSETGEPFRTRLPVSVADNPSRRRLLDLLVRSRLVTAHTSHYEVAHEALVRGWPRLRTWLEEDAAGQRIRRHLAVAAAGWDAGGRDAGELYRGARLEGLLEWLDREREPLAETERAFVDASQTAAQDELRSLALETRRQRRQNRRLRVLVAGASVLLLVAATAAGLAVERGREAADRGDSASAAELSAQHEALVARSVALGATDRAVGALLAIEAWRERPDVAALSALIGSVAGSPGFMGYRFLDLSDSVTVVGSIQPPIAAAAVPGSEHVLVSMGSTVTPVDPATGGAASAGFTHGVAEGGRGSLVRVSGDGRRAAHLVDLNDSGSCSEGAARHELTGCTAMLVYDVTSGGVVLGPVFTPSGADVAISHDGGLVAVVGANGDVVTWDVDTGTRLGRLPGLPHPAGLGERMSTGSVGFGRGASLFVGSVAGPVRELSASTLRVRRVLTGPPLSANRRLIVTPSGSVVASGDQGEVAWSLPDGRLLWATGTGRKPRGCSMLAVSAELERSYCSHPSGRIVERDLRTGQTTGVVLDFQAGVGDLTVTANGRQLVAVSAAFFDQGGLLGRWRLDGPGVGGRLLASGVATTGGYDPKGVLILTSGADPRSNRVLDADGQPVLRLGVEGQATWLSSQTIAVVGSHDVLVDVPSGDVRSAAALGAGTVAVHPEPGGTHAWAVSRRGDRWTVRRFEVGTGQATPTSISLDGGDSVKVVSDGRQVVITTDTQNRWRSFTFDVDHGQSVTVGEFDGEIGSSIAAGLVDRPLVAITPDDTYLTVNLAGEVKEYADFYGSQFTLFSGAWSGDASSLQLSTSGDRLLVTSPGQTAQLYDTATRTPLGGPLASDSPTGVTEGWLRPDGERILVNTGDGLVEMDLDPEHLVESACQLAGRDLTETEWARYVGDQAYRSQCPEIGLPKIQ